LEDSFFDMPSRIQVGGAGMRLTHNLRSFPVFGRRQLI
jgi:hypothetical protein